MRYGRSPSPETRERGLSEVRRGKHGHHNGANRNGTNIKMAWGAKSVEAGHSQGDGAGGSMSVNWDQVVAAFSNSASLLEGATQQLLQFCVETGKKANETKSNLEATRKEIQALQRLIEEYIVTFNNCRAQQIGQEDYIGQLEQQLTELKQRDRDLTQELQEVTTK